MSRWEFLRLSIADSGFRSLEEGERVSYEPTRGRKGEQAENVRKVWTLGVPARIQPSSRKGNSPKIAQAMLRDVPGPVFSDDVSLALLAIHPAAQQTHQDVKDKIPRCSTESYGIEARLRKERPRRVLHEFSEAVDGGNGLVSVGAVVQAEQHDVS
jgi:hypothetical protein